MVPVRKACLVVIDGWGIAPASPGNAIALASLSSMPRLQSDPNSACTELVAHGIRVGLPEGLMGNSEVGHLNIGAGRVVYQDIVRIDMAVASGSFISNPAIKHVMDGAARLHLVGLVSDGGVHSHMRHLLALLTTAKELGVKECYVHFIADGRDTAPASAAGFLAELLAFMDTIGYGKVASLMGRYYAMDRDKRWERTGVAVDALTSGTACTASSRSKVSTLLAERLSAGQTDEFLTPILLDAEGCIRPGTLVYSSRIGDSVLFFNFRADRMRQLVDRIRTIPDIRIASMTQYRAEHDHPVISPPQRMSNVLAEWLSRQGLGQVHIAETEKYAHVTFFFNGGREGEFAGEQRVLIPSPKVATYDLAPAMSVLEVAAAVAAQVESGIEFVMCNLAPPDMVGHTGKLLPTIDAVMATDQAIQSIWEACRRDGRLLFVTADHGNAEQMLLDGSPHTAHTCNPVLLICWDPVNRGLQLADGGALCDVAPTVLQAMGVEQPREMTGRSLLL